MIENKLHHDFWAMRDIDRVNWIGKFQTALGVNYVRGDEGIVRKFETKVEAAAAAARALCNALDEGAPPRSLAAKFSGQPAPAGIAAPSPFPPRGDNPAHSGPTEGILE